MFEENRQILPVIYYLQKYIEPKNSFYSLRSRNRVF